MDNWNMENNKDSNVNVSGQFNSSEQQDSSNYDKNIASQSSYSNNYQNNYGQSSYGTQNNQNGYGQNQNMAGGYGQPYASYNQPPYQGPGYAPVEMEEPVGMGEWAGLLALLSFVPCIGVILAIVWAFGKTEKKSKANFCKAYLVIWLIKLALYMIVFIIWGSVLAAAIGNL